MTTYTKEKFLEDLKLGKTWTLEKFAEKPCEPCFGKGNGGPLRNYERCPACNATGKVTVDYLVKW